MPSTVPEVIEVAVAAIVNERNQVLISLRPQHAHQGGLWEFPGGKLEAGESVEQALRREIREELGLSIGPARPLIGIEHDYGDRRVRLHVWRVEHTDADGLPGETGLEGQPLRWQAVGALDAAGFPAADAAIITALQLPGRYLISGDYDSPDDFTRRLQNALQAGIRLVQLRLKDVDAADCRALVASADRLCAAAGARLMLNVGAHCLPACEAWLGARIGLHLTASALAGAEVVTLSGAIRRYKARGALLAASCHSTDELARARALGCDFAVLSPVRPTATHPRARPMGWAAFADHVAGCNMPVYALGGLAEADLPEAWRHGAQGIAGIRFGWK